MEINKNEIKEGGKEGGNAMSRRDFLKKSSVAIGGLLLSGPFAGKLLANTTFSPKNLGEKSEKLQNTVTLGNTIDYLTTDGTQAKEVMMNGKKVGVLLLMKAQTNREAKTMFISAHESPAFYTKENDQYIPNISAIQKYFDDYNKEHATHRKISLIATGPTFDTYGEDVLSGLNYDNGKKVGTADNLNDTFVQGRGIAYITGKKLHLSHSTELSQTYIDQLIRKKADIITMSSIKRDGNINNTASIRKHTNAHMLVQLKDGTIGELILNHLSENERKKVLTELTDIDRALYSDSDASNDFLDGMWVRTQDGLKYSHPGNPKDPKHSGDIFNNINTPEPAMVKNNMPGLLIFFSE